MSVLGGESVCGGGGECVACVWVGWGGESVCVGGGVERLRVLGGGGGSGEIASVGGGGGGG